MKPETKKTLILCIVMSPLILAIGISAFTALTAHKHTPVIDPFVASSCTSTGLTEGTHCSVCGEILRKQEVVSLQRHMETAWIIDADATCTTDGLRHKKCTVCGQTTKSEVIKSKGHRESDWIIDIAATASTDGSRHIECTSCHTKLKTETIRATDSLGLAYTVNSDNSTCTITGIGECTDEHVIIPTQIDGYKVTAIATRAFYECTTITAVTIPSTVTSIGTQIFYKATNLATVYYNSPYSSNGNPFLNTPSITKVVFGGSKVPSYILYQCSFIKEVEIKDSVTSIGEYAFSECTSLKDIPIPDSVTSIGWYAFSGCTSLKSAKIPHGNTNIDWCVFYNCTSLTSVTIPDSVTSIGYGAFEDCSSLTSVTIPDSVTSIGNSAFRDCTSLTSVTIPNSVTSIGYGAFEDCSSLKEIHYGGTRAQWNAIAKGSGWNYCGYNKQLDYTLYCTDGTVK